MTYQSARELLELIYFASGIFVAIFAGFALYQIRISKAALFETQQQRSISALRDSLTTTAEQCKYYNEIITPRLNQLDRLLKELEITSFSKATVTIEEDKISIKGFDAAKESEKIIKFAEPYLEYANAIESFSMYFITGVADEKVAFQSIGETFCTSFRKLAPLTLALNKDGSAFHNAINLFALWGKRIERKKLMESKEEINKKLSSMKSTSITPIGVSNAAS